MTSNCGRCEKTVYATEAIQGAGKTWHKLCFRCSDTSCNIVLTLKTFKGYQGQVYCNRHEPKAGHTSVADSVSVIHALQAPKRVTEGLHKTQVDSSGHQTSYGLNAVGVQHSLKAPQKTTEGLHKTIVGENKSNYGLEAVSVQHSLNAPKKATNQNPLNLTNNKGSAQNLSQSQDFAPRQKFQQVAPSEQQQQQQYQEQEQQQQEYQQQEQDQLQQEYQQQEQEQNQEYLEQAQLYQQQQEELAYAQQQVEDEQTTAPQELYEEGNTEEISA